MYTFELIADSRFTEDVRASLRRMEKRIESDVSRLPGVELVRFGESRSVVFDSECYQERTRYILRKTGRAVTWVEVFRTINATKAPVYERVERGSILAAYKSS